MAEALLDFFAQTLPTELSSLLADQIAKLQDGDFFSLLQEEAALEILGHQTTETLKDVKVGQFSSWNDYIFHRLGIVLGDRKHGEMSGRDSPAYKQHLVFLIGYAALLAFLQSTVTGPPLPFSSSKVLFPEEVSKDQVVGIRRQLVDGLGTDGVAAYRLTPNVELLCFADAVMTCPPIIKHVPAARWAKLRVSFVHQRLLSEVSSTLQDSIYSDVDLLRDLIETKSQNAESTRVQFALELASIETYYGFDKRARAALDECAKQRNFQFACTGLLGRRTKFQQFDISQLVVLAKSADDASSNTGTTVAVQGTNGDAISDKSAPSNLDLNDDTLLEAISFTEKPKSTTDIQDSTALPSALTDLDPSNQPQLKPLDSIILLSLASSITNTSPADGLTREETIPYATRVLEGGSSNWQVYTQALLVRSRIEGYRSRTIERGLLQLQTLVDQVIADTATSSEDNNSTTSDSDAQATSFLPRPKESESAPASERLRYIFQLATPSRWELEAELAARWVSLGGLRSALEIYERLEMWAEAALCWAATDREEKAKTVVRRLLFHATNDDAGAQPAQRDATDTDDDSETWQGPPRDPAPADAPRLYCILGDLDQDATMYETAWAVSGNRYARAQRSLARLHFSARDFVRAAEAYSKSLRVNQLNQSSWFALGCCLLELAQFPKAVEAFSRCVQLDETDAEAWSNLAAALLKQDAEAETESGPSDGDAQTAQHVADDEEAPPSGYSEKRNPLQNRHDALRALKRAATLKHDSFRIWENVMIVAASLKPVPDYASMLTAQKHLIDLRGASIGEKCIDADILEMLVRVVVSSGEAYDAAKPGLERLLVECVEKQVVPLITASRALWRLVARLALWRKRPAAALDANEKAWRAVTVQPGWENESEARWNDVVDATVELCDAYESLGPMERNEGLSAGQGVLVAKDWRFKARSAVRGIMGRGKESWEDSEGWARLRDALDNLRG